LKMMVFYVIPALNFIFKFWATKYLKYCFVRSQVVLRHAEQ
jgi:hypothetical protein